VKIPLILYEAIVGVTAIHFVHRSVDLAQPRHKGIVGDDVAALVAGKVGVTPNN
jgi:hypothetical protein